MSTHRYLGPLIRCLNRVSLFLQILAGQSGSPTASPMDCLANGLPIYCWTKCQCIILSVMGYTGDLRSGYLFPGFPDYWRAPGARSHLHVPRTPERAGGVRKIYMLYKKYNKSQLNMAQICSKFQTIGIDKCIVKTSIKYFFNFLQILIFHHAKFN